MLSLLAALFLISSRPALACPAGHAGAHPVSKREWSAFKKKYKARPHRKIASDTPWGGSDSSGWRPEAVLANSASSQLNLSPDAVVAVPVIISQSTFHPYGDGQSNAAIDFGSWHEKRPPLVAVLTGLNSEELSATFTFDHALPVSKNSVEINYVTDDGTRKAVVLTDTVTRNAGGDLIAVWKPDSKIHWGLSTQTLGIWIRPTGWTDWFPVYFRHPVLSTSELEKKAGITLIDPEGISAQKHPTAAGTPFDRLMNHKFGPAYNSTPYYNKNIHGDFPVTGGSRTTGVGEGWTWFKDRPDAPFKMLYTCFGGRRLDLEQAAGVPTSGGWHEIGDPAETIINSLETASIPVGWGAKQPMGPPPSGAAAFGLSDVVTIRQLKPGEALVTPIAYFHWFFFPSDRPVCTEEWVHPAVPTNDNQLGLKSAALWAQSSLPVCLVPDFVEKDPTYLPYEMNDGGPNFIPPLFTRSKIIQNGKTLDIYKDGDAIRDVMRGTFPGKHFVSIPPLEKIQVAKNSTGEPIWIFPVGTTFVHEMFIDASGETKLEGTPLFDVRVEKRLASGWVFGIYSPVSKESSESCAGGLKLRTEETPAEQDLILTKSKSGDVRIHYAPLEASSCLDCHTMEENEELVGDLGPCHFHDELLDQKDYLKVKTGDWAKAFEKRYGVSPFVNRL